MKYFCVYYQSSVAVQIARFEKIADYLNWADSAHENGVKWSHLIENATGKIVGSYSELDNDKKYNFR